MTRITGMIDDDDFINPLLLDVMVLSSDKKNQSYDLPYHFDGEILSLGYENKSFTNKLEPLGTDHGYQFLWKIAEGKSTTGMMKFSWLDNNTIHTLSAAVDDDSEILLVKTGANDPNFNLRTEASLILRETEKKDQIFAAILEVHGKQNESTEMVSNQESSIQSIKRLTTDPNYLAVEFKSRNNTFLFLSILSTEQIGNQHLIHISDKEYKWTGNYKLVKTIR